MKFWFSAYDFVGFTKHLEERGHEIVSAGRWGDGKAQTDAWWNWMLEGRSSSDYTTHVLHRVRETGADVVVLGKGWHHDGHAVWSVEPILMQRLRERGVKVVYVSWDDPDQLPQAAHLGLLANLDVIGTCCPDPDRSISIYKRHSPHARFFTFWPGWDQEVWERAHQHDRPDETCDVLIGGTPYVKPNPEYSGPPRRDVARAVLRRGWSLELWGSKDWTHPRHGGTDLAAHYHGPYGYRKRGTLWSRARVNVNVHLRAPVPLYLNDRFFQVIGGGRSLICDRQPGVERYFPEGIYVTPGDLGEYMDAIAHLLLNPDERIQRGKALRARVLKSHTLAHRADAMLKSLSKL